MKQQVKTDWIINNQNIFGLQQDINLSISSIQYEILNQVKGKNINSISDYLGAEIDISKEIRLTKKLTIEKVFAEFLGFENINPLEQNNFNCSLILGYLQLSLFKEYSENKHKNILTFSEYKTQYNSLLNSFLTSNIDTDEQDFIKAELTLCNNLLTEMNKPVYSVLSPLNEVLDKPCEYKKNLINSIDKRKKFLEQKANEKLKPVKPKEAKKQIEIWYSEYELRQFIDMALRWGIDGVYKSRTENNPFSVFDHYVKNARKNFDLFANQLNTKLTENENWKAIGIDLNSRFLKGLNQYIIWYNENRNELEKFQPYCPYSLMLNVIESTKAEILKYFPELENETLPPQQTKKSKPEQETPQTFDELFYNIELVQPSIDILKEIEPPLIDTEYNYIGKLKGIICVWIDELQRQGIVKSNYPEERKLLAALIPQKIKRFSIDESMFGKYQSKAENNYRTDIKTKVSKIKLSRNSQ